MPIHIGVLIERSINRLYVSSVSIDDEKFDTEHVLADCSPRGAIDYNVAVQDLRILRNKLTNGDVPNANIVIETEGV